MNTLQNYYGLVMRADYGGVSDVDKLYRMKKAIAAIIHRCSESLFADDQPNLVKRHEFCPRGKDIRGVNTNRIVPLVCQHIKSKSTCLLQLQKF